MNQQKQKTLTALGNLIKKHRINLGISQEELGFRSNLDRTYISGIERGIRNPSLTALVSLAQGLNITTGELLTNLEDEVNQLK